MHHRRRQRLVFSGFTKAEIEKMEKWLKESDQPLGKEFFQKVARSFSSSAARSGKPAVKRTEVQCWFESRLQECPANVASNHDSVLLESSKTKREKNVPDLPELKYEARSSHDGAWYDVDTLLSRRVLTSREFEVLVRFTGFGAEDDEWVNKKNALRERSIPLENSDCEKLNIGDEVCCFQERSDQGRYFDAHILDIKRKEHGISDCSCLFSIRYDHDNTKERVPLERLCYDPIFYRAFMR